MEVYACSHALYVKGLRDGVEICLDVIDGLRRRRHGVEVDNGIILSSDDEVLCSCGVARAVVGVHIIILSFTHFADRGAFGEGVGKVLVGYDENMVALREVEGSLFQLLVASSVDTLGIDTDVMSMSIVRIVAVFAVGGGTLIVDAPACNREELDEVHSGIVVAEARGALVEYDGDARHQVLALEGGLPPVAILSALRCAGSGISLSPTHGEGEVDVVGGRI